MSNETFIKDGIPTLRVKEPQSLNEYALIDVRRPEEFVGELGHIQGARLKSLGPDLETYLEKENREQPILFICRSGARSAYATEMAQTLGFKKSYNMEGGMILWHQSGFPFTQESE